MKSLLCIWWCLLALVAAAEDVVVKLTAASFDNFIKENPVSLIKFYAPWCGHCKTLAPEYSAAAEELKKQGSIPLAEVDATEEKDLATKFNIKGFPTMFLFRHGTPEPYAGGRTKETIIDYVKRVTGPPVEWKDSKAAAEDAVKSENVAFLAALASNKSEVATTFLNVADSNRLKGKFVAYINASGDAKDTITCYRKAEEPTSTKITTTDKLKTWIDQESVPLLGPVNADTYAMYESRSKNWVWFAADAKDYQTHGPAIRKVSKNYRSVFNFVWLNTDELKAHAEAALGIKEYPGTVIVWEENKYMFDGNYTEKALTKFVDGVMSGKVGRFIRSEPIPESNDEAVKIVVGKNFEEIVLQKDKDVFLKIYAPWCGHCKKLAPVWDEFAERTKGSKNFVVAKMDGTMNEAGVSGFEFRGFPTLYFVKAGEKTPVSYDGDRSFDSLVEFAKKHSAHPIIVGEAEDKDEL